MVYTEFRARPQLCAKERADWIGITNQMDLHLQDLCACCIQRAWRVHKARALCRQLRKQKEAEEADEMKSWEQTIASVIPAPLPRMESATLLLGPGSPPPDADHSPLPVYRSAPRIALQGPSLVLSDQHEHQAQSGPSSAPSSSPGPSRQVSADAAHLISFPVPPKAAKPSGIEGLHEERTVCL